MLSFRSSSQLSNTNQYGVEIPNNTNNKRPRLFQRKANSRQPKFIHLNSIIKDPTLISQTLKNQIKSEKALSAGKRFMRTKSSGHIAKINSQNLLNSISGIRIEDKNGSGLIKTQKCIRDLISGNENGEMRVSQKSEEMKLLNQKLNREVKLLQHQIFIKDTRISDLQSQVKGLGIKLRDWESLVKKKSSQLEKISYQKDELENRISCLTEILKNIDESKKSGSTRDETETVDLNITSTKPIVQIETDVIISNLHKKIQYQQIEIAMLKRSQYVDHTEYQMIEIKKENKILKQQNRRLKKNNIVLINNSRQKTGGWQSSIELEISKD